MMNTKVLNWVKNFKYSWLPEHVNNDTQLIEIISTKLDELEQLLETSDSQCQSDSPLVLTSIDNDQVIDDIDDENEIFSYPAIRIKRISLAEAEDFLPPGWETPKSKPRRKPRRKRLSFSPTRKRNRNPPSKVNSNGTKKPTRSSKLLPSQSSESPSINEIKSKHKRKLRAIDREDDDLTTLGNLSQTENMLDDCEQISRYIGQNGILSQTRRTNETTMNATITTITTIDEIDDMASKIFSTPPPANEDVPRTDNHVEYSSNEKQNSISNYEPCIEDITNDGIDPPLPTSSSSPNDFDQLPLTT